MSAPASTAKEDATLLIVYEDKDARDRLRKIFEDAGYRALTVSDAPSALRVIHKEPCDLGAVQTTAGSASHEDTACDRAFR
jgi:DNA-binding NtrC family response regulator